jgi:hypothetical protein
VPDQRTSSRKVRGGGKWQTQWAGKSVGAGLSERQGQTATTRFHLIKPQFAPHSNIRAIGKGNGKRGTNQANTHLMARLNISVEKN